MTPMRAIGMSDSFDRSASGAAPGPEAYQGDPEALKKPVGEPLCAPRRRGPRRFRGAKRSPRRAAPPSGRAREGRGGRGREPVPPGRRKAGSLASLPRARRRPTATKTAARPKVFAAARIARRSAVTKRPAFAGSKGEGTPKPAAKSGPRRPRGLSLSRAAPGGIRPPPKRGAVRNGREEGR